MNKFYKFENEVSNSMPLSKSPEMCFTFLNKESHSWFCLLCIHGTKGHHLQPSSISARSCWHLKHCNQCTWEIDFDPFNTKLRSLLTCHTQSRKSRNTGASCLFLDTAKADLAQRSLKGWPACNHSLSTRASNLQAQ